METLRVKALDPAALTPLLQTHRRCDTIEFDNGRFVRPRASTNALELALLKHLHIMQPSRAVAHLPEWLLAHWADTTSIMLAVDEANEAGRRSYAKAGWVDLGIRDERRIEWVRYMKRDLQTIFSNDLTSTSP